MLLTVLGSAKSLWGVLALARYSSLSFSTAFFAGSLTNQIGDFRPQLKAALGLEHKNNTCLYTDKILEGMFELIHAHFT